MEIKRIEILDSKTHPLLTIFWDKLINHDSLEVKFEDWILLVIIKDYEVESDVTFDWKYYFSNN